MAIAVKLSAILSTSSLNYCNEQVKPSLWKKLTNRKPRCLLAWSALLLKSFSFWEMKIKQTAGWMVPALEPSPAFSSKEGHLVPVTPCPRSGLPCIIRNTQGHWDSLALKGRSAPYEGDPSRCKVCFQILKAFSCASILYWILKYNIFLVQFFLLYINWDTWIISIHKNHKYTHNIDIYVLNDKSTLLHISF